METQQFPETNADLTQLHSFQQKTGQQQMSFKIIPSHVLLIQVFSVVYSYKWNQAEQMPRWVSISDPLLCL